MFYTDVEIYHTKEAFTKFKEEYNSNVGQVEDNFENLKETISQLHVKLSNELSSLMVDVARQVKKSLITELGGSPIDAKELAKLLLLKADKSIVESELNRKADVTHIHYNDK